MTDLTHDQANAVEIMARAMCKAAGYDPDGFYGDGARKPHKRGWKFHEQDAAASLRAILAVGFHVARWRPIAEAQEDPTKFVNVYAAPRDGLPGFVTVGRWHPDAGWCVDELRKVTLYQPLPEPPKENGE